MKKLLLLSLFIGLFALKSNAQRLNFEYDAAGNQITRSLCFDCSFARIAQTNNTEKRTVTKEDYQKFFPEDVISYYPNPVKDELYLQWELTDKNEIKTIDVYNFNGQIVNSYNNFKENKTIISFANFAIGTYIVQLSYNNGDQKNITIIKQN